MNAVKDRAYDRHTCNQYASSQAKDSLIQAPGAVASMCGNQKALFPMFCPPMGPISSEIDVGTRFCAPTTH